MKTRSRRPPKPDRRHALELLASCPDGCSEVLMAAHGVPAPLLAELVRDGLAATHDERVMAGGRLLQVARVKITDAGRRTLNGRSG
jgi:hypothetical protein